MPCRLLNVARLACSVAPVWAWLLLVGCNSSPVEAPALSASSASEAAISQFDKNGNQSLDAAELAQAPGLLSMLKKADTDSDAALSQAELTARISEYGSEGIVLVPFSLQVMLDGAPLADAEVTLQPEKLMSEAYKPVKATTDDEGLVSFRMESSEFTGVYAGVYRVEVSKKNAQGKETLPSRYNTATTLGQEIAIDVEGIDHAVILKLTSR